MNLLWIAIISSVIGNIIMWFVDPYRIIPYALWTIYICIVVGLMIA